jgi:hypothetical protein
VLLGSALAAVGAAAPGTNSGPHVLVVHNSQATEAFRPQPEIVASMVDCALTNFTRQPTPTAAWLSLISTQDVIGLKVFSDPGPNSGTRPSVVEAVVQGLLKAGVPARQIVIWDRQSIDLRFAGYFELQKRYGIRVESSFQAGYDPEVYYDNAILGNLVWGDLEFGKKAEGVGRRSHVSKLVTKELRKIINITPLLNHYEAGVCGNLYSLAMGSVDNIVRFESDPRRLATAVPEIYNLPELADRVVLNIVDALVCQYAGSERALLHYSTALNELRVSKDPVALDTLSLEELTRQRRRNDGQEVKSRADLYSNAELLELGIADPKKIQVTRLDCP